LPRLTIKSSKIHIELTATTGSNVNPRSKIPLTNFYDLLKIDGRFCGRVKLGGRLFPDAQIYPDTVLPIEGTFSTQVPIAIRDGILTDINTQSENHEGYHIQILKLGPHTQYELPEHYHPKTLELDFPWDLHGILQKKLKSYRSRPITDLIPPTLKIERRKQ
jgi:hypothetical protein